MSQLSNVLRDVEDNGLSFWCPGCKTAHTIYHSEGTGIRWGWNGDINKPTFTPSVLVKSGHYAHNTSVTTCWCTYNKEHPDDPSKFTCKLCHSFITNGKIQFLGDCTHELVNQTVDLPDWPY